MSASYAGANCTVMTNGPCHAAAVGETTAPDLAQLLDPAQAPLSGWDFQTVWQDNGPGQFPTLR
jgi:hypothetical protein